MHSLLLHHRQGPAVSSAAADTKRREVARVVLRGKGGGGRAMADLSDPILREWVEEVKDDATPTSW